MESPLRPEVLELMRVCENLEADEAVLIIKGCEAMLRCATQLESNVLPDRPQDDIR